MSTLKVPLKEFAKVLGEFNQKSLSDQRKAVTSGVARSIPDLVKASPIDTGLYAQSWDFTATEQSVILGNYAPHAPMIESGARPFKPPLQPLLQWAKRVLKDNSQPPNYSSQVWGLAKYTQKKIMSEGILPRHILENALPKIIENIKQELKNV